MDDIYGPVTEHPEYDIGDERRFTITIYKHRFEPSGSRTWAYLPSHDGWYADQCRCGYPEDHPVHVTEGGE